jgi:ATP-dependent DNA helicase RecG
MIKPPLTPTQVRALLLCPESERLERKSNLKHPERIRDTICAFANDLDGTREPGVLLIGADDQGRVLSDRIPDETLRAVVDLRNNGTVLPLPVLDINRVRLSPSEEVLVIRVFPAEMPPLRASGRVLVRKGSSTVADRAPKAHHPMYLSPRLNWSNQSCPPPIAPLVYGINIIGEIAYIPDLFRSPQRHTSPSPLSCGVSFFPPEPCRKSIASRIGNSTVRDTIAEGMRSERFEPGGTAKGQMLTAC